MPKKICDKCNKENGVAARRCKFCDTGFAFKVKKNKIKGLKVNWRELMPGDLIKVLGGGPIWKTSKYINNKKQDADFLEEDLVDLDEDNNDEDNNDEDVLYSKNKKRDKILMGYRGKFKVFKLDDNGIIAFGMDKNCGCSHIWMTDEKLIDGNLLKRPHRIIKIS